MLAFRRGSIIIEVSIAVYDAIAGRKAGWLAVSFKPLAISRRLLRRWYHARGLFDDETPLKTLVITKHIRCVLSPSANRHSERKRCLVNSMNLLLIFRSWKSTLICDISFFFSLIGRPT